MIRRHGNRWQGIVKSGLSRWYADSELPEQFGSRLVTVRRHGTAEDQKHRFNRTENVRPIPPGDPDFDRLFPRSLSR